MKIGREPDNADSPATPPGGLSRSTAKKRARASMSTVPRPFLRWAGSKRAHLTHLLDILPGRFQTYWEPFVGAGSLYFLLRPRSAVLGDACKPLIDTFRSVRDGPKAVLGYLSAINVNEETYYEVRAENPQNRFHRAANFIYLNKTCWNGLYRVNSRGDFNVPYGHPKTSQIVDAANLLACGRQLRSPNVRIVDGDFEQTLIGVNAGDLVFLDPPYVTGHSNNGFIDYNEKLFSWSDQERLASVAKGLVESGAFVIVTNADHADVVALYRGFKQTRFARQSTIAADKSKRRVVREVILHTGPTTDYGN